MGIAALTAVWFLIVYEMSGVDSIQWLGLAKTQLPWNQSAYCVQAYKRHLLAGVQKKACKRHLYVMPFLTFASQKVMATCQDVFADRRWNCSSIETAPKFGPDLTQGTREQAFVYALSTAALAYTTARACSDGSLSTCDCGRVPKEPPPGNFVWGGCADNVKYGVLMAKTFTEMPWNRRKFRKRIDIRMNRHNSRAGWRSVNAAVQTQCKCHGVSGSCSVKTCWAALPSLHELALRLKRKYQQAEEVEARRVAARWKLFPLTGSSRFNKDDLVYTAKSPDYCISDPGAGSAGTKGRLCNATSSESDGCQTMCCGRGYMTTWMERAEHCQCKYHYCCYVTCSTCTVRRQVHLCL